MAKFTPDVISYGAGITACARADCWPIGLSLFSAMCLGSSVACSVALGKRFCASLRQRAAVQANVVSFSSAIGACRQGGHWQMALKLFDQLLTVGLRPDVLLVPLLRYFQRCEA